MERAECGGAAGHGRLVWAAGCCSSATGPSYSPSMPAESILVDAAGDDVPELTEVHPFMNKWEKTAYLDVSPR